MIKKKEMSRIVVSFTTIPSRVEILPLMLWSLVAQTAQPAAVYLNIASEAAKGATYDFERLHSILSVFQPLLPLFLNRVTHEDLGPIMKLAPVLDLEQDPSTLIILVDDDTVYSSNIIEELVAGYERLQTAVGFAGRMGNNYITSCSPPLSVDFLETFHGSLYPRFLFPPSLCEFVRWCRDVPWAQAPECFWTDDIVLGFWVRSSGHQLWVLPADSVFVLHDYGNSEALRDHNLHGGNAICMKALGFETIDRDSLRVKLLGWRCRFGYAIRTWALILPCLFVLLAALGILARLIGQSSQR
jgi:hypothetical protein